MFDGANGLCVFNGKPVDAIIKHRCDCAGVRMEDLEAFSARDVKNL